MKRIERLILSACCAALTLWLTAPPARAGSDDSAKAPAPPESWELSPYRVNVLLRIAPAADWPADRRARLIAQLTPRASALLGGVWRLTVDAAPPAFPWSHAADPAGIGLDAIPAAALEADKLLLLAVEPDGEQIKLWTRELDVRTQLWGPPQARSVAQAADLPQEAIRTLWAAFRPLAQIESVGTSEATIRVRGGSIPAANRELDLARASGIWQPVVRHRDASGNTIAGGVFTAAWTWLQTTHSDGPSAQCRLAAASDEPLSLKYDGRTDYLALAVTSRSGTTTKLTAMSAGAEPRAMEGLEIWQREGDAPPRLVGRTDANGAITVGSDSLSLLTVYLRDDPSAAALVKLPLVPGWEAAATASIDDGGWRADSARLVAESGDRLLEAVAEQKILKVRLTKQLIGGKKADAEQTLAALSATPTKEKFNRMLDSQRGALPGLVPDSPAAAWLDKQIEALKTAAKPLLDEANLANLRAAAQSGGK